jgi:hypothetical protein
MARELFRDAWVSVTERSVACGGATYQAKAIAGVRLASVRETALAKIVGFSALLVVCDFAVCAAASETFRDALLVALVVAGVSLSYAFWWAPETHYVMLNLGGSEVALVRYAKKLEALECMGGIEEAVNQAAGNG